VTLEQGKNYELNFYSFVFLRKKGKNFGKFFIEHKDYFKYSDKSIGKLHCLAPLYNYTKYAFVPTKYLDLWTFTVWPSFLPAPVSCQKNVSNNSPALFLNKIWTYPMTSPMSRVFKTPGGGGERQGLPYIEGPRCSSYRLGVKIKGLVSFRVSNIKIYNLVTILQKA